MVLVFFCIALCVDEGQEEGGKRREAQEVVARAGGAATSDQRVWRRLHTSCFYCCCRLVLLLSLSSLISLTACRSVKTLNPEPIETLNPEQMQGNERSGRQDAGDRVLALGHEPDHADLPLQGCQTRVAGAFGLGQLRLSGARGGRQYGLAARRLRLRQ